MPVLKSSCCGCCTISTGARILGIISLVVYGLQLLSFLGTLATFNAVMESIDCSNRQTVTKQHIENKFISSHIDTKFDTEGLTPHPTRNQPSVFDTSNYGKPVDPVGHYSPVQMENFANELSHTNYESAGGFDGTSLHTMSLTLEDSAKDWLQKGLKSMSQFDLPPVKNLEPVDSKVEDEKKEECEKLKQVMRSTGYPILVVFVVILLYMVISSLLLLIGIGRRRRAFLLPWIIGESLAAVVIGLLLFTVAILIIFYGDTGAIGAAVFVGIVAVVYVSICIYCILIVVSCYQELGLSHPCVSYSPQQGGMVV